MIISERKQAEEALRLAQEKYHSSFAHAVKGIFQSTPQGRYLTVNPAMARIYGYSSPEDMLRVISDIGKGSVPNFCKVEIDGASLAGSLATWLASCASNILAPSTMS